MGAVVGMEAAVDCNRLAAAEMEAGSSRLEAAVDCSRLAAAEVEAAVDLDWRQQWIAAV